MKGRKKSYIVATIVLAVILVIGLVFGVVASSGSLFFGDKTRETLDADETEGGGDEGNGDVNGESDDDRIDVPSTEDVSDGPDESEDDMTKDAESQTVTYTVTFVLGNGQKSYVVEVASGAHVTAPPNPIRGGYMFSGWYADSGFTTEYDFSAGIYADTTIYAGWVPDV